MPGVRGIARDGLNIFKGLPYASHRRTTSAERRHRRLVPSFRHCRRHRSSSCRIDSLDRTEPEDIPFAAEVAPGFPGGPLTVRDGAATIVMRKYD